MLFLKGHTRNVQKLTFSADGSLLASADESAKTRIWRFPHGREVGVLPGYPYDIRNLVISPDSRWIILPKHPSGQAVLIVDAKDLSQRIPLSIPSDHSYPTLLAFGFSADGTHLEVAVRRGWEWTDWQFHRLCVQIIRWELGTWQRSVSELLEIPYEPFKAVSAMEPRRTLLAMAVYGGVQVWNYHTGNSVFAVSHPSRGEPSQVEFNSDGTRLAFCRNRRISTVDVSRGGLLSTWQNPTTKHIQSLAFSPDGKTLASVSNDTVVRFWETDTGRELKTYAWELGTLKAVAIAPDGLRAAASGRQGEIVVWDLND